MAADNWRELLRLPGVESVMTRAIRRAEYALRHRPLVADDFESFAWDHAVVLAEKYDGPLNEEFLGWLYRGLVTYGPMTLLDHTIGRYGTPRYAIAGHMASLDAHREDYGDTALDRAPSVFENVTFSVRRLTRDDPLAILMRIELWERALRKAETQARYADGFVTETTPSPYCSEPSCLQPIARAGMCGRHYQYHRARWGRPDGTSPACSEADCDRVATARGFCKRHYQLERNRRLAAGEVWSTPQPSVCTEGDCDRPTKAKGLCIKHYTRSLRATIRDTA